MLRPRFSTPRNVKSAVYANTCTLPLAAYLFQEKEEWMDDESGRTYTCEKNADDLPILISVESLTTVNFGRQGEALADGSLDG
jgi:hypothetical protein